MFWTRAYIAQGGAALALGACLGRCRAWFRNSLGHRRGLSGAGDPGRLKGCGSSSVGRALAFQA